MVGRARHFLRHLPPPTPFSQRWACETMRPETVMCGLRLRARDSLESTEGQEQRLKTNIKWSTERALTWGWVVEVSPWSLLREVCVVKLEFAFQSTSTFTTRTLPSPT